MSAPVECNPCCPSPSELVNVPGVAGEAGAVGASGVNGVSSFTSLTSNLIIPNVGANVTAFVTDGSWAATGQVLFLSDGTDFGSFRVVTPGTLSLVLTYLGYSGEALPGAQIDIAGSIVTPGGTELATPLTVAKGGTNSATATLARAALGVGGDSLSVYAAGTAYQLTATPAKLVFGTTSPSLTITSAGVWLLLAKARIDNNAKTTAAVRTITLLLRRTNNTAADIANSPTATKTAIMTTLTFTLTQNTLPAIIYTTTNANDVIEIWGSADDISGAGTFDAVEASLVAVKLYNQTV